MSEFSADKARALNVLRSAVESVLADHEAQLAAVIKARDVQSSLVESGNDRIAQMEARLATLEAALSDARYELSVAASYANEPNQPIGPCLSGSHPRSA